MKSCFLFPLLFCLPMLNSGQQIINLAANQLNIDGVFQIEVTWQTIDERHFCRFTVERDTNNSNSFTDVHILNANGDAPGMTLNYSYTDFGPLQNGVTYSYRLRLDTADFSFNCFFNSYVDDTVIVDFTASIEERSATTFQLFPNPTNGNVIINSINTVNSIQINNAIGEVIYHEIKPNNTGQYSIDLTDKPIGIYFISINSGNNYYYHKLIKQ